MHPWLHTYSSCSCFWWWTSTSTIHYQKSKSWPTFCNFHPFTSECNEAVDLIFVVDSSNSICPEGVRNGICPNWLLLRKFLQDVVYILDINSGRARVGVVMFGYEGQLIWGLDQYVLWKNENRYTMLLNIFLLTCQYLYYDLWHEQWIRVFCRYTATEALVNAIDDLEYLNQWTNIADGIRKMRQQGFTPGKTRSAAHLTYLIKILNWDYL